MKHTVEELLHLIREAHDCIKAEEGVGLIYYMECSASTKDLKAMMDILSFNDEEE